MTEFLAFAERHPYVATSWIVMTLLFWGVLWDRLINGSAK